MAQVASISASERVAATTGGGIAWVVGFFFAFRLFIMLLSVWILGTDPQTGVALSLVLNCALLAAVAFGSFGGERNGDAGLLSARPVRWALMFLGFSFCSLSWSVAASLSAAVAFWCAMAADSAMVLLLLRDRPAEETTSALMKGYVCGASLIAVIAWLLPPQPDLRLGYEDLLGPNQIGFLCGFAFFFAQYLARSRRGIWTAAMVLLGVTLLRSLSKTTIAALFLSQLFVLVWDRAISRRTKLMVALGALLVSLVFWNLLSAYYDVYINAGSQSENLTGRVGLWAIFLGESLNHPWIGHGFHSVWKVIAPYGPEQFEARHAHNELLQQFYAYGAVGVLLFLGIYGSFFRMIRKMPRGSMRTFFFSFLLFALIRGFADTEPFDLSLPLWTILLITAVVRSADLQVTRRAVVSLPGTSSFHPATPHIGDAMRAE